MPSVNVETIWIKNGQRHATVVVDGKKQHWVKYNSRRGWEPFGKSQPGTIFHSCREALGLKEPEFDVEQGFDMNPKQPATSQESDQRHVEQDWLVKSAELFSRSHPKGSG